MRLHLPPIGMLQRNAQKRKCKDDILGHTSEQRTLFGNSRLKWQNLDRIPAHWVLSSFFNNKWIQINWSCFRGGLFTFLLVAANRRKSFSYHQTERRCTLTRPILYWCAMCQYVTNVKITLCWGSAKQTFWFGDGESGWIKGHLL